MAKIMSDAHRFLDAVGQVLIVSFLDRNLPGQLSLFFREGEAERICLHQIIPQCIKDHQQQEGGTPFGEPSAIDRLKFRKQQIPEKGSSIEKVSVE